MVRLCVGSGTGRPVGRRAPEGPRSGHAIRTLTDPATVSTHRTGTPPAFYHRDGEGLRRRRGTGGHGGDGTGPCTGILDPGGGGRGQEKLRPPVTLFFRP